MHDQQHNFNRTIPHERINIIDSSDISVIRVSSLEDIMRILEERDSRDQIQPAIMLEDQQKIIAVRMY